MADSFTPNLNLDKPEVGAANNLWGGSLNSDLDILDSIFTSATTMLVSTVLKSDTSIADATTTSKRMLFNLTGISTSTTRNLTVQDADGTLAYTAQVAAATTGLGTVTTGQVAAATVGMVDTSSSQILSNKTLTAPLLTGILAASTGVTTTAGDNSTKLATTAYVDRITLGWQRYQPDVVISGSSAASIDITGIPADVKSLMIVGYLMPVTNGVNLWARFSQSGAPPPNGIRLFWRRWGRRQRRRQRRRR